MVSVVSQPRDDGDAENANGDSIAVAAFAPAVDLFVESPSAASYVSGPRSISGGSLATAPYHTAMAEYDLRSLRDDLVAVDADDLLPDILAESQVTVPL